jgi:N6-adenosine-specific RNA methylase IME4
VTLQDQSVEIERRHIVTPAVPTEYFDSGPFVGLPRHYFKVAYIDPPWRFQTWSHRGQGKGASQHYETWSFERLKALPVPELMVPDGAVFSWVVQPLLPEAVQLLTHWECPFRSVGFIWVKMPPSWTEASGRIRPRLGLGYHTRSGTEQCWLGIRGKGYKRQCQGVEQVLHAPIRAHSQKPDEIANRIARLVGDVPRIELFARTRRPGWVSWGDELDKFSSGGEP